MTRRRWYSDEFIEYVMPPVESTDPPGEPDAGSSRD